MAINSNLTLSNKIQEVEDSLTIPEEILGKCLNQPFTPSNSGARKLLYSTQQEHAVGLVHPEVPYCQTGYEIRFGDYSSSIIKAPEDMVTTHIISKYSFAPQQSYTILAVSTDGRKCMMYKRTPYEHTTENHGFIYNNSYMDALVAGSVIRKDDVIRKSTSYDEYNNRMDGTNLFCLYLATSRNTEDSTILSESAAKYKLATPVIDKITIICNDNDIPLNLHGINGDYKVLPDIGETVKGGILYAQRRQNKEYAYFTESVERMKKLLISDDKYTVDGTSQVIDIDVFTNNTTLLQTYEQYAQVYKYHQESVRYYSELIEAVNQICTQYPQVELSYDLQKEVARAKDVLAGKQFIKENVYNNTIIEITVMHHKPMEIGDKMCDRDGGKGVVSFILPDEQMPMDIWGNRCDAIINKCTCVGRENPGQLFEMSLNYISYSLLRMLREGQIELQEAIEQILTFLSFVSPMEEVALRQYFNCIEEEQAATFLDSILMEGHLIQSMRPIQDNMTLDKLAILYKAFPWIKMRHVQMPIQDSMGNWRMVMSRRPLIFAAKYCNRLKQFSEEKFSVTSLSATNIKNLNTKSKANKYYKATHSNTPIALGTMESDVLSDLGVEYIVTVLMIHSVSPQARRLCEQMITGDPFLINIQLDSESTNRNVEMLNAYLKVKGERLVFRKIPKKKTPLMRQQLMRIMKDNPYARPLMKIVHDDENFDFEGFYARLEAVKKLKQRNLITQDLIKLELDEDGNWLGEGLK